MDLTHPASNPSSRAPHVIRLIDELIPTTTSTTPTPPPRVLDRHGIQTNTTRYGTAGTRWTERLTSSILVVKEHVGGGGTGDSLDTYVHLERHAHFTHTTESTSRLIVFEEPPALPPDTSKSRSTTTPHEEHELAQFAAGVTGQH